MNQSYEDIRERIPEPPQWFDKCAVPRYTDFAPYKVADIYANECALVEIACQSCEERFKVAFSRSSMDDVKDHMAGRTKLSLAERIRRGLLSYGDPPNTRCCPAGPTMLSEPIAVLEYWSRAGSFDWQRDQSLEIELGDTP